MRWHGQSADSRFHRFLERLERLVPGSFFLFRLFGGNRWSVIQTQSLRVLFADLHVSEGGPHGVAFTDGGGDFPQNTPAGNRDPHGGFVSLDLNQVGIRANTVTYGEGRAHNRGLGDGFAELRHDDREQ